MHMHIHMHIHVHVYIHIHKHAANAHGVVFWSFCDNLGSSTGFCLYCFKAWSVDVSVENIYQHRQQMAVNGSKVLQKCQNKVVSTAGGWRQKSTSGSCLDMFVLVARRLLDLSSDLSQNHQILG